MRIAGIPFFIVLVWSTNALVAPSIQSLSTVPSTAAHEELRRLEQDVETVIKKLRPTESDPTIGGTFDGMSDRFFMLKVGWPVLTLSPTLHHQDYSGYAN
jgi:hypothetical protein